MLARGKSALTHGGDTSGSGLTGKFIVRGSRWNGLGPHGQNSAGENIFSMGKSWIKPDKAVLCVRNAG